MATTLESVYANFLSKIRDDETWYGMTDAEIELDLRAILNTAIVYFKYPAQALTIDEDTASFDNTLLAMEIEILTLLMKEKWLDRIVHDIKNLIVEYKERGYELPSQANHLAKLQDSLKQCKKDVKSLQFQYSVSGGGTTPDFSGTAGKEDIL
jgi:hypothetical protein